MYIGQNNMDFFLQFVRLELLKICSQIPALGKEGSWMCLGLLWKHSLLSPLAEPRAAAQQWHSSALVFRPANHLYSFMAGFYTYLTTSVILLSNFRRPVEIKQIKGYFYLCKYCFFNYNFWNNIHDLIWLVICFDCVLHYMHLINE